MRRIDAVLVCRVVVLLGSMMMTAVGYPPARAQAKDAAGHDELVVEKLGEMKARIDVQDTKIDKQWLATNAVKEKQATMDGEVIGFGALLTFMSAAGLVFQIRSKVKTA